MRTAYSAQTEKPRRETTGARAARPGGLGRHVVDSRTSHANALRCACGRIRAPSHGA